MTYEDDEEVRRAFDEGLERQEPPLKGKTSNGQAGPPVEPFPFWRVRDMRALKAPRYVVEGLIPDQALALIFAPSSHYKTMTAVDLVLSVAYRTEFHGLKVEPMPIVYVANEDAYGLARQRVIGWLDFHGYEDERIVVIPGDVLLNDPDTPARILATARDAFPNDKQFGVVLDTWDKSIGGDPDKTAEVVPAVRAMEELLKHGAAFVLTLSHTPWNNPERSKGSVTSWASYAARIKTERDEETGTGTLTVLHMKNGTSGLQLKFEYEQHTFAVEDDTTTTLIPKRIMDAPDRAAPVTRVTRLTPNQRVTLDALHTAIVDRGREPPPAWDIPRGVKMVTVEEWLEVASRHLPLVGAKQKNQAAKRAIEWLVGQKRRIVRCAGEWVWPAQAGHTGHTVPCDPNEPSATSEPEPEPKEGHTGHTASCDRGEAVAPAGGEAGPENAGHTAPEPSRAEGVEPFGHTGHTKPRVTDVTATERRVTRVTHPFKGCDPCDRDHDRRSAAGKAEEKAANHGGQKGAAAGTPRSAGTVAAADDGWEEV